MNFIDEQVKKAIKTGHAMQESESFTANQMIEQIVKQVAEAVVDDVYNQGDNRVSMNMRLQELKKQCTGEEQ